MSSNNGLPKYYIGILITLLRGRQNITEIWEWSRPNLKLSNKETISNKIEEMAREGLVTVEETLPKTIKGKKRRTKKGKVLEKNVELTEHGRNLARLHLSIERFIHSYNEFFQEYSNKLDPAKLVPQVFDRSLKKDNQEKSNVKGNPRDEARREWKIIEQTLKRKGWTDEEIEAFIIKDGKRYGPTMGVISVVENYPLRFMDALLFKYRLLLMSYDNNLYKEILKKIVFNGIEEVIELYPLETVDELKQHRNLYNNNHLVDSYDDYIILRILRDFIHDIQNGLCSFSFMNFTIGKVLKALLSALNPNENLLNKYFEYNLREERKIKEESKPIPYAEVLKEETYESKILMKNIKRIAGHQIEDFFKKRNLKEFEEYSNLMQCKNFEDFLALRYPEKHQEYIEKHKEEYESILRQSYDAYTDNVINNPPNDYKLLYDLLNAVS